MRVEFRPSELCVNALLEALGNKVLQPFGLVMNFFDRVIENLEEKGLQQPMVTDDLKRSSHACGREAHSAMQFILHQGG